MNTTRYHVVAGQELGSFVCTDQHNGIVCIWQQGQFNDSQSITLLNDTNDASPMDIARYMRQMGDYLQEHHAPKL